MGEMQVVETVSEGLKRQLRVTIPAGELAARCEARIVELKDQVQLKGFRKGKVPAQHLKKVFGRSVMAEVLQETVEASTRQALSDRKERPATQPKVELPEDQAEIEGVLAGSTDLAYEMSYEVLPEIQPADVAAFELERLVADVEESQVEAAIGRLADNNVTYEAVADRAAEKGDRLKIDFVGSIDGTPFEGGTAEGVEIVLGQSQFIPGFEEGLLGAKAGDTPTLSVTFPEAYPAAALAGKAASFAAKVEEVGRPLRPAIDDAFAKGLGAESLDNLRALVRAEIEREHASLSRARLKRELLDRLDKSHSFALPAVLVDAEFEGLWKQLQDGLKRADKTLESEGKSEAEARAEYRGLAERRVRLGLVLAHFGEQSKVEVTQDELRQAIMEQARRMPGQERLVYEYFEKTPGAVAELRAPIFEEKVVDVLIDKAGPKERKVTREELVKALEDEGEIGSAA